MRPHPVLPLLAAVLTGCGGSSGASPQPALSAEDGTSVAPSASDRAAEGGSPELQLLQRYLEVFAVGDAAQLRSAWIPLTARGSLARGYSEHQTVFREAQESTGSAPPREDTVERVDDAVQICTPSMGACRDYTDVVAQGGLLTSFTVNGQPLAGHVVQPGARATVGGVSVELVSGYETPVGGLFLCVRATNASPGPASLNAGVATYRSPDGAESTAGFAPGPLDPLAAGDSALVCPVFENGRVGGTLELGLTDGAHSAIPVELPVDAAPG